MRASANREVSSADSALLSSMARPYSVAAAASIMAQYVAPFSRYSVPNYQIVLNGVPRNAASPAMRRDFEMLTSGRSDHGQLVGETLVRYMGWSTARIGEKQHELRNPIAWFREGIAALLLIPLWLLQSLGLLSRTRSDRVAASSLFRLITGLVALIGLVGSIFTIVLGLERDEGNRSRACRSIDNATTNRRLTTNVPRR